MSLRRKYSGHLSRSFWNRIARIRREDEESIRIHTELYNLSVMLQNLEAHVLERLERIEQTQ
jgi:hypothetical protein